MDSFLLMTRGWLFTSLSKVLGSDRGPGLDARTETAVLVSLKTVVLGKHLDKL